MSLSGWRAGALTLVLVGSSASAQWRTLVYVRDTAFALDANMRAQATVLVGPGGRMVVTPSLFFGALTMMDSTGKQLPWTVPLGRGREAEVGWVNAWGWSGDSLWVVDQMYDQVVLLGHDGKVASSISNPSWIRPAWKDRRRYPLFSSAKWHAMYGDTTLLAEPSQSRRLLDTPGYDPDQRLLVRVDRDGMILRTVATVPLMEGRMQLRSGTERRMVNVPFYPRVFWSVAANGRRVVVVTPLPRDSGAFVITSLSDRGDTVFSRRYAVSAWPVARASVDSFLKTVQPFGRYGLAEMRDTIAKQIPAYHSPVKALLVGVDASVWVAILRPGFDPMATEWLVIDSVGEPVGVAPLPRAMRPVGVSVDRMWLVEIDRVRQRSKIVRYRLAEARGVRPSRTSRASAPASSPRPRE